jgi:hypothetical protein
MNEAYTVTFGDRAENEAGMQIIGAAAPNGVTAAQLEQMHGQLAADGKQCRLIDLGQLLAGHVDAAIIPEAKLLVIQNGVNSLMEDPGFEAALLAELQAMPKDRTTLSYGQVRNKHARHNNTMGDFTQEPDIANGMGTVVNLAGYPNTNTIRNTLTALVNALLPLVGELNHYFNATTCGIGYHGDAERRIVVGVRLGPGANGMPLKFQWYKNHGAIGRNGHIMLSSGDVYIMSEKAVGFDWKRSSILTLRHAAGKETCKYARMKRRANEEQPELAIL